MLHLHRAERADVLADALGRLLSVPPADPFASEVVAVPAKGVERWLTQRLSDILGICSGIEFCSPAALLARALGRADDAWDASALVWPLLDTIDECVTEPWCATLATYLGAGEPESSHRRGRRWATAAKLAELFTSYGAARPQLLVDWADGIDSDGVGDALPDDLRWQAQLWRRLRDRLGPSPAERLSGACAQLRERPDVVDLPDRLSLFGATRLSAEQLAGLDALAAGREVHLWLPHPSPALWERVAALAVTGPVRRRDDPSRAAPRHPLLASMGRDVRELQVLLAPLAAGDAHHGAEHPPATLLGRLQSDLAGDLPPGGRLTLAGDDRSVQVHACHGPARQVEVLREALLRLFADDLTLEPRDVLVMCPDVEAYAPLVSAAFGLGEQGQHPGHRLRVRLADRSLRQTNPLLDIVARLLDLADGRVTASEVLDLAATPGVRRRFGFDDDDLERLRGWVAASGVRWALSGAHRAPWHLEGVPQNTWRTGLDRLLLGVAASEDELPWLDLALPLDDVDSGDIDLAGRLAELLDRLETVLDSLTGTRPAAEWVAALGRGLELLTDTSERDAWQLAQARRELAGGSAAGGGAGADLRLGDVRSMLGQRLRGRPTRANFRTGSLTVCTMVPMRSVPHRVIALLGLDDGTFPRVLAVDGDDVLLRDPLLGERDRRSEDRQLMLDAVLAAQEHLLVLYTGADPLTGARRPPAVPVGELLDVLDATAVTSDGTQVRDRVLLHHPLQPFDARNFRPGALGPTEPFSFDRDGLLGARRGRLDRQPAPEFLAAPLPPQRGAVELRDLVAFFEHPVKALLRKRLQVGVPGEEQDVSDAMSVELEPLDRWDVGERMLLARLAGIGTGDFRQAELRRGTLPPGPIGLRVLSDLEGQVEELARSTPGQGPARNVDVRVDLGDGRLLTGTVGGVHSGVVVRTTYSRLGAKHRLRAWVQLLALVSGGEQGCSTSTTGRGRYRGVATSALAAPAPDQALRHLRALVEVYDVGMTQPLPLDVAATHDYARQRQAGGDVAMALQDADKEWASAFGGRQDRHNQLVWGQSATFSDLTSRYQDFDAVACGLWRPLLAAES